MHNAVADTDNDDEHAKEGGAEKGGLDSLADMFKDDAPFDIGGGDALDSLDLGVFGGGGRGVARGVGGGRGNAGGRRASTPAQRLTRTKDDFLAELGLDEEEENADDVEEDDEDDQGLGQTSKGAPEGKGGGGFGVGVSVYLRLPPRRFDCRESAPLEPRNVYALAKVASACGICQRYLICIYISLSLSFCVSEVLCKTA